MNINEMKNVLTYFQRLEYVKDIVKRVEEKKVDFKKEHHVDFHFEEQVASFQLFEDESWSKRLRQEIEAMLISENIDFNEETIDFVISEVAERNLANMSEKQSSYKFKSAIGFEQFSDKEEKDYNLHHELGYDGSVVLLYLKDTLWKAFTGNATLEDRVESVFDYVRRYHAEYYLENIAPFSDFIDEVYDGNPYDPYEYLEEYERTLTFEKILLENGLLSPKDKFIYSDDIEAKVNDFEAVKSEILEDIQVVKEELFHLVKEEVFKDYLNGEEYINSYH